MNEASDYELEIECGSGERGLTPRSRHHRSHAIIPGCTACSTLVLQLASSFPISAPASQIGDRGCSGCHGPPVCLRPMPPCRIPWLLAGSSGGVYCNSLGPCERFSASTARSGGVVIAGEKALQSTSGLVLATPGQRALGEGSQGNSGNPYLCNGKQNQVRMRRQGPKLVEFCSNDGTRRSVACVVNRVGAGDGWSEKQGASENKGG